jgi:hypothetical protein
MRGRTNTVTTTTSKTSVSTSKRLGGGKQRTNSDATRASSGNTSVIVGFHPQELYHSQSLKQITEVDGIFRTKTKRKFLKFSFFDLDTNIDEVLNSTDLSLIPISFLTEIQQDKVYETILEELRKKIPHKIASKTFPIQEEEEPRKPFSPHLFAINDDDDDDDDISITDEISSSTSSENNDIPSHDDYDTDIEPGNHLIKIKFFENKCFLF